MRTDVGLAEFIAKHAVSEPFRQLDILDTDAFSSWLSKRGVPLKAELLVHLWQIGVLHPVLVDMAAVTASEDPGRYAEIDVGLPSRTFVDLGRDVSTSDVSPTTNPPSGKWLRWHPFQLWEVDRTAALLKVNIGLGASLFGIESYKRLAEITLAGTLERVAEWANSDEHDQWLRILALSLYAEPLVHLRLSNRIRLAGWRTSSDVRSYLSWVSDQDGGAPRILELLDLSIERIQQWHERIASWALIDDPNRDLRALIRHVHPDKRAQLKGDALKADSLYDLAEVLRRYGEQYHGADFVEEDDALHGPQGAFVKQRLFGSPRTADFSRTTFRRLVRTFGLDPQARTTWVVEGQTENSFIIEYARLRRLDLDQQGVELTNLRGVSGLGDQRVRDQLERLWREEVFVYVSIDREADDRHIRDLQNLRAQGLLTAGFSIWERDFEEANFTLEELAKIGAKMATEDGTQITLSAAEIEAETSPDTLVGKAIMNLLGRKKYFGGKGDEWGRRLAQWAFDEPCPPELADHAGLRPIVGLFGVILRGQTSDFHSTTAEMVVDEAGRLVRLDDQAEA